MQGELSFYDYELMRKEGYYVRLSGFVSVVSRLLKVV